MKEKQFLTQLKKTAHEQSTFPSSHNRLTAFFWAHAWQSWLLAAVIAAAIYEIWQGRCSL